MRRTLAALALAVVLPLPALVPAAGRAQVVVRPGETLSEIADRHGVGLNRLMQANGITNPDLVVAGQRLVIPGSGASQRSGRGGRVTVQPGETLSDIAARYGVGLTRLMQANGISNPDLVIVGQRLVIPGSGSGGDGRPARSVPTAPYTVQSGETLSEIADRFGTTTERLIQINGIANPDLVVAGSRLKIPGRPGAATPRPTNRQAKEHLVSPGESLSDIADRYGTSVERLVAINQLEDPDLVFSGMRLKLTSPPAPKASAKPKASAPKAATKPATQPAAKPTPQPATAAAAAKPDPQPVATPAPQPKPQPSQTAPATEMAAQAKPSEAEPTKTTTATAAKEVAKPAAAQVASNKAVEPTATTTAKPAKPAERPVATQQRSTSPVSTAAATRPAVSAARSAPAPSTTINTASTVTAARSVTPEARNTAKAASTAGSSQASNHDWRSYGPLQVDWANWQSMGGSYVAPTLNGDGQPLYLAINCGARKVNATTQAGQWKTWDTPQTDFEQKLVADLCKAKGS